MRDWTEGPVRVLLGDVRERLAELPDESAHACVTSPPYWGLRDYGVLGQLGLESTPDEYVCRMVEVFREVRRLLRRDGTLWLNLGDSYAHGGNGSRDPERWPKQDRNNGGDRIQHAKRAGELKPKDLAMMPSEVAIALRRDGWWLRSDIIWSKPTAMPESVTDRPTTAHEHVFLLAKAERYFYDADAVREPLRPKTFSTFGTQRHDPGDGSGLVKSENYGRDVPERRPRLNGDGEPAGANLRSVWTIASQPYPEAHFATFPEELARRCIAAGTSERGCCPECGAPWRRVVDRQRLLDGETPVEGAFSRPDEPFRAPANGVGHGRYSTERRTTGWEPTCSCEAGEPVPCTVLDPFAGSGTTLAVARRMGRRAVGIELQADYLPLIQRRVSAAALPLLEALEAP